ncbi:AAA family ATPase [Meridianimarinicoccus aquatilis]|uniref:Chromosome partitioning protein n=1 Tax=Meridianimarinicoccus aquatilis TaxID=2552766 RepID=A0A4V3BA26_9RHOB|nr:AAA family ATPase [Fluviibacterium aquatile]QIE43963.1 AAA family ATPase [Rhodobacteraceae bacterium SC52]TDL81449.1 chromosome partitioning protein [Fluviibacterium aquatile]
MSDTDRLPPYFNIPPDTALAELGPPVGTDGFAKAASQAAQGRADLVSRGLNPDGHKTLRRFSTWEVTRYLIPVATPHFRRVLKQNPDLPQGHAETAGGTRWFTLDEVLRLRAFFAAEGSKSKGYLPYRPKDLPAKVVAVANFKGGVGKTSTAAHLAMSAALDGYRVLVIDLDSQGSMTSIFGGTVADEWATVFPLLARDYAESLQAENRSRMGRGDTPLPLDDMLAAALKVRAGDLAQKTHWPNIDLIGAQLNLYWAEFQVPVWRMGLKGWKLWDALTNRLDADGMLDEYDIVILDTPPALGYLTINALSAADILLVPLGASFLEFDSTGRFFDMLHATFNSIEEGENIAARALGTPELRFEWDAVRAVVTRFDASQQMELANLMQAYIAPYMSPYRQDFTALVGQAGEQVAGIYEADYRDFNRETYIRGRETFDETYAAFKRLLVGAWRRDELELQQAGPHGQAPV